MAVWGNNSLKTVQHQYSPQRAELLAKCSVCTGRHLFSGWYKLSLAPKSETSFFLHRESSQNHFNLDCSLEIKE